jgi:type I restriction enzyme M protein
MTNYHHTKVTCCISGKERLNTPEEEVRQAVLYELITKYGYSKQEIEVEFPIKIGSSRRRVDIAIFISGKSHKQQYIITIIECKRKQRRANNKIKGQGQIFSYLAACLNARYGKVIGGKTQSWEKAISLEGLYILQKIDDIPVNQNICTYNPPLILNISVSEVEKSPSIAEKRVGRARRLPRRKRRSRYA